jgi:DNA repair exonuclease SbcCD ATPase subunit
MAEIHKSLEQSQQKLADLKTEIAEKDTKLRQLQASPAAEADLKKLVAKLQEEVKSRDDRLTSFEIEGQSLSKKQGEMEKLVRKTKSDLRERETEITKLKESKEQLIKAIEELQDLQRKNESDASNATKSLSAMQAVSQATTDKLIKLETEIASKIDEINAQKRALEQAWNDNAELKRAHAELRAERDDLRRQIGEGTSKVFHNQECRVHSLTLNHSFTHLNSLALTTHTNYYSLARSHRLPSPFGFR